MNQYIRTSLRSCLSLRYCQNQHWTFRNQSIRIFSISTVQVSNLILISFFYLISQCCAASTEDDRGSVHIDDTVDGLGVGGINISNRSADKEEAFIEATKETPKENSKRMVRRGLTTSRENITRLVVELNISNILAEKYLTFTHFSLKWL